MDHICFLEEQLLNTQFCSVRWERKCTREGNSEEQHDLQARGNG